MTRTVIATVTEPGYERRTYNDGAWASRNTDPETGKTVKTIFADGKGHAFIKNLRTGIETYFNHNAHTTRVKDLNTGEVVLVGPGGPGGLLMYAIRQSGDGNA